jgi:hypothetical protein
MKPLAEIRTYDDLSAALRLRAESLKISRETIDAISGLQPGYAGKLLAPVPIKTLSRVSLGAMLGALGVKLILVPDVEMMAKIEKRLIKRRRRVDAGELMLAKYSHKKRGNPNGKRNPELMRLLRMKQLANQSDDDRKRLARKAARARWGRRSNRSRRASASGAAQGAAASQPAKAPAIPRTRCAVLAAG